MIQDKKRLSLETIEELLLGSDPTEGIRYVDVNYYSNKAKLFIRKPADNNVSVVEEEFRPFVWFKGFNFEVDFLWDYFSVNVEDFDPALKVVMVDGVAEPLSAYLEKVSYSPNRSEVFFRRYLHTVDERKKLCYKKIKEYNVSFEEQITGITDQKAIDRLDNGFKFLVHIDAQDAKNYSNPILAYNNKGTLKKISGSFSNLIDFFQEGGLNLWKRSGVFLNEKGFYDFWNTSTIEQKVLFFFGMPFKTQMFSLVDKNKSEEFEDDLDFSIIDYDALIHFVQVVLGEKAKKSNVFSFFEKKLIKGDYSVITEYAKELWSYIDLKPDRMKIDELMENDFSFDSKKGFAQIKEVLFKHGIDIFNGEDRQFFNVSPLEQYMIQSGKRLFKGFENYADLRIMVMDIETKAQLEFANRGDAALSPFMGRIFKIGVSCNNGYEQVFDAETDQEEKKAIEDFFTSVMENEPDLFLTYNGEHFDFPFILKRYEMLCKLRDEDEAYAKIQEFFNKYYSKFEDTYIGKRQIFNRRAGTLKVGGSSERYMQTTILGVNMCDTMFAVKRASAINKSIPNFKLKDNIKHAKLNKKNRVYVDGDKIGEIENSKQPFYLNEQTGHWFKFQKSIEFIQEFIESKIKKKTADSFYYENENTLYVWDKKLDNLDLSKCVNTIHFNENLDDFFPAIYNAMKKFDKIVFKYNHCGSWLKDTDKVKFDVLRSNLKLLRESLHNINKFYPEIKVEEYSKVEGKEIIKRYLIDDLYETQKLDEFYSQATFLISKWLPTSYQRAATMGGASVWKLLLSMYSYKFGLAIPEFDEPRDFSGGLVSMLSCGYHGKSFKGDFSSLYPAAFYVHTKTPEIDLYGVYKLFMYFGWSTRIKYKTLMNEAKERGELELAKSYDVKQLPIKILINSFYGMMGAAAVTPFADILVANGITCNGRQHLRYMIKWFKERGFFATIAHTDGVFFSITEEVDLEYKYKGKGANWLVKKDKEYTGIEAYVAEYNDLFMKGIMGLDIDDIVESVINFSKGNYIYLKYQKDKETQEVKKKLEIVGGSVIKKTQSEYIASFVQEASIVLLENKPVEFVNDYWNYIQKIQQHKIPAKLIASKAKIKKTKDEYLAHIKGTNKNGQPLNRQVHMELLLKNGIDFEIGDTVHYVNSGKTSKDKDSQSVSTTIGTIEINEIDIRTIENIIKSNDRGKIKQFLTKLYENEQFVFNAKLHSEFFEFIEGITEWKAIKTKTKNLKKGIFVDIIKVEYHINCGLVDINDDSASFAYNEQLYLEKFNSAVHPLFICFKPEVREKLQIQDIANKPFVLEDDLKLINSIPFKGHEEVQTSYEDTMVLSEEEWNYWNEIGINPDDFLVERK